MSKNAPGSSDQISEIGQSETPTRSAKQIPSTLSTRLLLSKILNDSLGLGRYQRIPYLEARETAMWLAVETGRPFWIRELSPGNWIVTAEPCGYYQSTEEKIIA